jgi:hypothetical protein
MLEYTIHSFLSIQLGFLGDTCFINKAPVIITKQIDK